jgi:alginate O-acetyltransferase complex protein AlgI
MTFTSPLFLAFLVPVFLAYWGLRGRGRLLVLLLANYTFYAWWDRRLLWALLASTALNYLCGRGIAGSTTGRGRRAYLMASLTGSLALLAYFKYYGFFAGALSRVAGAWGWHLSWPSLLLPLGISYYTLQMLSYTLDIHRGVLKPTRSPLVFAAFASFFPHIVAGPITRARQLLPQLERGVAFDYTHLEIGSRRFLAGLFKKLFIADTLAHTLVDPVFANPDHYSRGILLLAVVGYAVQIYADFSGYSSMAIGVARLFGLKLPENFKFPYLSRNIAEFWRRWHITLSSWLRDYLWWPLAKGVPLSGGFRARLRAQAALVTVFLVCGLWHGAAWTFAAWGALHGVYIVIYEIWNRRVQAREGRPAIPRWVGLPAAWLITQLAVGFSWILFRAGEFATFKTFLHSLLLSPGSQSLGLGALVWLALLALPVDHLAGWMVEHRPELPRRIPAPAQAAFYTAVILFLFHARPEQVSPFIYFRF